MKNVVFSVLIAFMMLPVFTPMMPHDVIHALHDHQAEHHNQDVHNPKLEHDHSFHEHHTNSEARNHHPISFDAVAYFTDFLHVDLQSRDQIVLQAPILDAHEMGFILTALAILPTRYEQTFVQSRVPLDWRQHVLPNNPPLYLSTQRLRI